VVKGAGDRTPYEIEFRLLRADGVYRPHIGQAFPLHDDGGGVVRWFGTNTDVADERELRRLAAIVQYSDDAIIGTTPAGVVTSWNTGAERLYGYAQHEALGQDVAILEPENRRFELSAAVVRVLAGEVVDAFDAQRVTRTGRVIEVSVNASPIRGDIGDVVGVSRIERDITDRKRMERELEHQALHDSLTGLPNRALFMNRLTCGLAGRRQGDVGIAVMFIDLDDFKLINDSLGHSAGDALLQALSPRLTGLLRRGDTVARFGGDEFVVLCETRTPEDAVLLAQRMLRVFEEPFEIAGTRHVLNASVGIAFGEQSADPETLVANADAAMYRAKEHGGSRLEVFDADVRARIVKRLETERRLRRAVTGDELHVHFQPIIAVADGTITGFEALLRWTPPDGPPVPPSDFIPVAERCGLIHPIGELVLRQACRQAAQWHRALPEARVWVNVSAHQLSDPGFGRLVRAVLAQTGLDPHRLCLEITESALMEQPERAVDTLAGLRAFGTQVALDDFGTGYSSLSHLKLFPLDAVKIDRSFVAGLATDSKNAAILEAVVHLAHTLELRVVGEGVETAPQARVLQRLGCGEAQGFLYGRPMPAKDVLRLLEDLAGKRHRGSPGSRPACQWP
jgi:diguanylate cyclase (GGDEF)-like protein/PAS domain S-box-containing protein